MRLGWRRRSTSHEVHLPRSWISSKLLSLLL